MTQRHDADFTVAYYSGNRKTGRLAVIRRQGGKTEVRRLETGLDSGQAPGLKPILIGATADGQVIVQEPRGKTLSVQATFPVDAFAAHLYSDPTSNRDWFMNDGDKESGNDTLNCGNNGSSVTVIENSGSVAAKFLKTICVGRGHHQAAFTAPSATAPDVPRLAYISNLKDGTLSVIGNDPARADTYLQVIATINLAEPDKEEHGQGGIPNNAFPHGLAYSPLSGKVYNLNNGYGTLVVIDPRTQEIERRIAFKGHSNLFIAPGGRYIIGRGADRKSDPNHVIAKLSVLDVQTLEVKTKLDLPDIYISKYYFNPAGTRLYLTTSSSGSPEQAANIKADALLVLDISHLPQISLRREIRLGAPSGALDFAGPYVFSSNAEEGVLALIDAESDALIEKIKVCEGVPHSRVWVVR